ncbi:uncharacterized protein LOC119649387 [Hermetia illucens]|uniref:uncharacterized protein LOC119649387 n=1 Tax=Hermetia illucens TaxID=343691 RepID=UPI0018CC4F32|nr:uncharacterized protein LOC119649387 [Hermetia illucens]
MRCAVFGCNSDNEKKNRSEEEKKIRFYTFPEDKKQSDLWKIKCCRKDNLNAATSRVCSRHFTPEDYKRNLQHELLGYSNKKTLLLKNDAFPSLFLPKQKTTDSEEQEERTKRLQKRINKSVVNEILEGIREPLEEDVVDERTTCQYSTCALKDELEQTQALFKYIATLLDLTKDVECGINIKKLFFKSRMYFRIRSLNKNMIESKRLPYKRKLDSSQEDKKRKRKMRKIIE